MDDNAPQVGDKPVGTVATHPDACPSCACIRRHAWWCRRDELANLRALDAEMDRAMERLDLATHASEAREAGAREWAEELG